MTTSLLDDDLPARTLHARLAVISVVLLTFLLYWIDMMVASEIHELTAITLQTPATASRLQHLSIVRAVLENLMAGTCALVILAYIFKWIVKFVDPRDRVIEVAPTAITSRLRANAQRTKQYVFIGNTATFVTSTILPILVDGAISTGSPRAISLYLIDLMDAQSVASYTAFKNQILHARSGLANQIIGRWTRPLFPPSVETDDAVVAKILAAMYMAAFASLQTGMSVSIYLRRSFTPFRSDISEKEIVLTQESPTEAGVAFSSRGDFYGWYHKEAAAQMVQATSIDLSGLPAALHQINLIRQVALQQPINIVHPFSPVPDLIHSLVAFCQCFQYLSPLAVQPQVINLAARRVSNPSHSY